MKQASTADLLNYGFRSAASALEAIRSHPELQELLPAFVSVSDPDKALGRLLELGLTGAAGQLPLDDPRLERLLALVGGSVSLGQTVVSRWNNGLGFDDFADEPPPDLREVLLQAVGADPGAARPVADGDPAHLAATLRREHRKALIKIAAADLAADNPSLVLDRATQDLSRLADATLEAALAIARLQLPEHRNLPFGILALGKSGGRELNYQSDLDVQFFTAEPDGTSSDGAESLARTIIEICAQPGSEPPLWPIDTALRPEGRQGALVRSLQSAIKYYENYARPWEFQALLKARPAAGDTDLLEELLQVTQPLVWSAASRPGFVQELRKLHGRRQEAVPRKQRSRDLKHGPGGLRDVEFTVQLLQLTHGQFDASVRSSNTLRALDALERAGYLGREISPSIASAYSFLRVLEHRIQLRHLRPGHLLPESADELRILSRAAFPNTRATASKLEEAIKAVQKDVRAFHEDVYYRPIVETTAAGSDLNRLDQRTAIARLQVLGYRDPVGALSALDELSSGPGRTARIHRQLAPALLKWLSLGADPDMGVRSFVSLSAQIGTSPWYLALLRDANSVTQNLCTVLANSQWAEGALAEVPDAIRWLGSPEKLQPKSGAVVRAAVHAALDRHVEQDRAVASVKRILSAEIARSGLADLTVDGIAAVRLELSSLGDIAVHTALHLAKNQWERSTGVPAPTIAAMAMGHFGGQENSYTSDLDLWFVHDNAADEIAAAEIVRSALVTIHQLRQEAMWEADLDLRPEGGVGPIIRSLDSSLEYYRRWASPWERQALLRLRACGGDADFGEKATQQLRSTIWDSDLTRSDIRSIRTLKARMESERLPRGVRPESHVKLGPGGMADVEWTVQLTQLTAERPLHDWHGKSTTETIQELVKSGALASSDGHVLTTAWELAARIRSANWLSTAHVKRERANQLPDDWGELRKIAAQLGLEDEAAVLDSWRRAARSARAVMNDLFWS